MAAPCPAAGRWPLDDVSLLNLATAMIRIERRRTKARDARAKLNSVSLDSLHLKVSGRIIGDRSKIGVRGSSSTTRSALVSCP